MYNIVFQQIIVYSDQRNLKYPLE